MIYYTALTAASLKMFFRNWQGVFWSLFFPGMIMVIFGLINFGGFNPPDVGVIDQADNEASRSLIALLQGNADNEVLDVTVGGEEHLRSELRDGELDTVFFIPPGFADPGGRSVITVTSDVREPEQAAVAVSVLADSLAELFARLEQIPDRYVLSNRFGIEQSTVEVDEEEFSDFLVPGIAAMAIMQGGIFGVVFSLVRFRAQGVLRRLYATPIGARHFLAGQVITRLTIALMQAAILLGAGALILDASIGGSVSAWISLAVMAILGGALFISMGLAISGWANTEDVAAPVSNLIALPMMFLSGVFFPIDVLPDALAGAVQFLPLTYLADGMREAALDSASLFDLGPELLGLAVWTVITFGVATRLFRWE